MSAQPSHANNGTGVGVVATHPSSSPAAGAVILEVRPDAQLLEATYLRVFGMQVSLVKFLLAHPSVETLELNDCDWGQVSAVPLAFYHQHYDDPEGHGGVRAVHLVGSRVDELGFAAVLQSFPRLRTLTYCRPADDGDRSFDAVGAALAAHGARLEHLKLLDEGTVPFASPVGSLRALANLKTLEAHLELLVGFREASAASAYEQHVDDNDGEVEIAAPNPSTFDYAEYDSCVGDWSLDAMLPDGLEALTLHVDSPDFRTYFASYPRLGARLEALLAAPARAAALRYVQAPGLAAVVARLRAAGSPLLADGGWAFDGDCVLERAVVAPAPAAAAAAADE